MLNLSRREPRHEDIVTAHYAAMRRAALRLTHGDEAAADDLLHDAFVRFLILRPDLDRIGHLDGYLFTMLRNVYLSSRRRRARQLAVIAETEDIDLLAAMVDEPDAGERLRLRDELARLVDHACSRTRVSRGANAWILRCIHGYYPGEIAHLMKVPTRSVDTALSVARREAQEQLKRPKRQWLSRLLGTNRRRDRPVIESVDSIDILRARVFDSVEGSCLTTNQIAELYRPDIEGPVFTGVLAHIVCCADCLDRVNHHLGLSPLAMRDPTETNGTRRRRSGGGPGDGPGDGAVGGSGLDRLLQRTDETLASINEHVPKELRITANGLELGAQPVNGPITVQDLMVRLSEALSFVEIFDERGKVLCYWPAHVPDYESIEAQGAIELAHGGRFDLRVVLGEDCPRLRVCYTDARVHAAVGENVRALDPRAPLWRWLVPSERARVEGWRARLTPITVALLIAIWMTMVGPEATWAALLRMVDAVRSLVAPTPGATPAPRVEPPPASSIAAPVLPPEPAAVSRPRALAPATFSPTELAELEMSTRVTLHTLGADLGEDISVAVAPAGVTVRGIAATAARTDAIAQAFAGQRGVTVRVRTIDEVAAGTRRARRSIDRPIERTPIPSESAPLRISSAPSPVLEKMLASRFPNPTERAAYVNTVLAYADTALARAWALRRLQQRYTADVVTMLSTRSQQSLLMLVRDHGAEMRTAVDSLVIRLTELLAIDSPPRIDLGERMEADASIDRVFVSTQSSHESLHVLLAGDGTSTNTLDPTAVLSRLRRVQADLARPDFGTEILVRH